MPDDIVQFAGDLQAGLRDPPAGLRVPFPHGPQQVLVEFGAPAEAVAVGGRGGEEHRQPQGLGAQGAEAFARGGAAGGRLPGRGEGQFCQADTGRPWEAGAAGPVVGGQGGVRGGAATPSRCR